ncbi:MAG: hypothetical protein WAM60_20760, partial [Candidatus Promineifilaceae bacterium]
PEKLMIGYVSIDTFPAEGELNQCTILGFEWLSNGELGQAYVFSYDPEEDSLALLLQSNQLHSFSLSPDGRWLAASLYDDDLAGWLLKVASIEDGQGANLLPWQASDPKVPVGYDWSADSRWLLVLNQGILGFYSPESDALEYAPPPIPGCVQAVWMN